MAYHLPGIFIWIGLIVMAIPYVRHARHPDTKPLAAYLIFVMTFSVTSGVLFWGALWIARWIGAGNLLDASGALVALLAIVFIIAFAVARWQLRLPPKKAPRL